MNVVALANIIAEPMMRTIGLVKMRIASFMPCGLTMKIVAIIMREDRWIY